MHKYTEQRNEETKNYRGNLQSSTHYHKIKYKMSEKERK